MPIIKSAIKRAKQATIRRNRNVATKKAVKEAQKAFAAKPTAEALSQVQKTIDTAVKKNVLNKNTAARKKALFAKKAKQAGVKLEAAAKAEKPAKAPAKKSAAKKTDK